MGFFEKISKGLSKSRNKFRENMSDLLQRGPALDTEFWDGLEEALIMSDMGGVAACKIVLDLEDEARDGKFHDTYGAMDRLYDKVAATFTPAEDDIFSGSDALILFVGINGTGKTTTVGKIAKSETDAGRKVILGSADTFRAAAIEQLEVWAQRANVEIVTRERGADPASVCYDTIERAEAIGAQLVLIDTAGRLHTSDDLMRELQKVVQVTRKRSKLPVYTVLVVDATTGQNGMMQARQFNESLDLDGLVVTKLDGTAKGGIALAVSHEMGLPIYRIGVGEGIEDLRPFNAQDYARALLGDFDERATKAQNAAGVEDASVSEQPAAVEEAEEAEEAAPAEEPTTSEEAAPTEDLTTSEEVAPVASEEPAVSEEVAPAEKPEPEPEPEPETEPETEPGASYAEPEPTAPTEAPATELKPEEAPVAEPKPEEAPEEPTLEPKENAEEQPKEKKSFWKRLFS